MADLTRSHPPFRASELPQWHPTRPVVVSVASSGLVYVWAVEREQSWTAYNPRMFFALIRRPLLPTCICLPYAVLGDIRAFLRVSVAVFYLWVVQRKLSWTASTEYASEVVPFSAKFASARSKHVVMPRSPLCT